MEGLFECRKSIKIKQKSSKIKNKKGKIKIKEKVTHWYDITIVNACEEQ